MSTETKSPHGWLKLYLLLVILGGLLIFLYGIVCATHSILHTEWALWIGGISLSVLGFMAWSAFAKRAVTAYSLARYCIVIFLMLSYMFAFAGNYGYSTIIKIALFIIALMWASVCGCFCRIVNK